MASKRTVSASLPVRRGLTESEASVYLSLSPSFFRQLVEGGVMPRPRIAGRRRIWDIEELDMAFKSLPREGGETATFGFPDGDSWTDYE
jgi:excisionase family DNA binding protein